jgi:predicted CXXCH cytochrome family protein
MDGLGGLCFSCHDGAVTPVGQWIPTYANHPVDPGVLNEDCDRCHNPHEGNSWKFATASLAGSFRNANLCASGDCHDTGTFSHPKDVQTGLPIDRTWDPDASPADFSGTRLFNEAGDAVVPSGSAYIKCATCHASHGGVFGSDLNSMANYQWVDDGDGVEEPGEYRQPVCENCHR